MNRYLCFVGALLLLIVDGQQVSAAEAVGMEILQDGESVAGFTITYSGESEAEIWLKLKQIRLTFQRDFSIPVDPDDPTKATLTGKIEVRTRRRGDPGTSIVTDRVELVRRGPTEWFMVDSEVDRTLKASGLPLPAETPPVNSAPMGFHYYWLIPLSLIVLIVVAVAILIRRRVSAAG